MEKGSIEYDLESNSESETTSSDQNLQDAILFPSSINGTHRWALMRRQFMGLTNRTIVTCSSFCSSRSLLVAGLSNGIFSIWDVSGEVAVVLQSMSAFQDAISSICLSATGAWIGMASKEKGQLTVWEWGSESFQLRQKGIPIQSSALAVNPDGSIIASGARDGGILLWDTMTNFSFVSLGGKSQKPLGNDDEKDLLNIDPPAITTLAFCKRGKVLVAGSLDGTIKAFDLLRYRNFRTFCLPPSSMGPISLLAVDPLGEIVAAVTETPIASSVGAPFGFFLWSLSNGHLVDVIGGHQSALTALVIDPIAGKWIVSGSMDKTVRLWNLFGTSSASSATVATFNSEILAIAVRPDSTEIAISLLSGAIIFCDTESLTQISSIEPQSTPRTATLSLSSSVASFSTLSYSPDSSLLFAGGGNSGSKVYIFGMEASHRPFLKQLDIHPASLTLKPQPISNSLASNKKQSKISSLISSAGSIAMLSLGEGIFIFTLDESLMFDPFDIADEVTPSNTLSVLNTAIENKDVSMATSSLIMSLKLNDPFLQHHLITAISMTMGESLRSISHAIPPTWAVRFLCALAGFSEAKNENIQILLQWIHALLSVHSTIIKKCATSRRTLPGLTTSKFTSSNIASSLRRIESVLVKNYLPILKKATSNLDHLSILPVLETLTSSFILT